MNIIISVIDFIKGRNVEKSLQSMKCLNHRDVETGESSHIFLTDFGFDLDDMSFIVKNMPIEDQFSALISIMHDFGPSSIKTDESKYAISLVVKNCRDEIIKISKGESSLGRAKACEYLFIADGLLKSEKLLDVLARVLEADEIIDVMKTMTRHEGDMFDYIILTFYENTVKELVESLADDKVDFDPSAWAKKEKALSYDGTRFFRGDSGKASSFSDVFRLLMKAHKTLKYYKKEDCEQYSIISGRLKAAELVFTEILGSGTKKALLFAGNRDERISAMPMAAFMKDMMLQISSCSAFDDSFKRDTASRMLKSLCNGSNQFISKDHTREFINSIDFMIDWSSTIKELSAKGRKFLFERFACATPFIHVRVKQVAVSS